MLAPLEFSKALKGTEEFLMLAHSPHEEEMTIVHVSSALARLLRYTPEELIGKSAESLRAEQAGDKDTTAVHSAVRCGHELIGTVTNRGKDGSLHPAEVSTRALSSHPPPSILPPPRLFYR